MTLSGAINTLLKKSSNPIISWKPTGRFQRTIRRCVELSGKGLHSGKHSTVRLWPELAGRGRHFHFETNTGCSVSIPASIDYAQQSPLCTALLRDGVRVRTVEHLLSALEATGVDNCRIQIIDSEPGGEPDFEVPLLDGSAKEWVRAVEEVGLVDAEDERGSMSEKLAPYLDQPVHVCKNDAFITAFPSPSIRLTYGIDFPQVSAIGSQWCSFSLQDDSSYVSSIASARTFCVYQEVEYMRSSGLIKGGSLDNALVCSSSKGWLNPPLYFPDEPCRHKILDLIGDFSLFAKFGNQGLPVAHIVAYKACFLHFV
ncbi:putative UDP-3-O-acyl-N-acetylglucosamine deacetylase 1, mitochondrial [Turnera subulata]|uniref:UDP-3-O-acyl-N-acetylglucosamine deacetylase n=1 Tax=Turnera subulata TaxID=218843 RepID=A0A9Q0JJA5_9ROSI|nr:putative UDP-3-O-acyl-N-acetylglucosamine deacetylase 1, mitochondrial [Turnera subulata]